MTTAAYGVLPGNILTLADQSFENGTIGSWKANGNVATIAVVNISSAPAAVFEGSYALSWETASAGTTQVATGNYACTPGEPYIASAQVLSYAAGKTARIGLSFYNGSTWTTNYGPTITTIDGFNPVQVATVCPAGCTVFEVVIQVAGLGASVWTGADFVFAAQSKAQVLVDWLNPAYAPGSIAGNAFVDLTPFVNIQSSAISIARGRQDAVSDAQTGICTLKVDNPTGWFTVGSTASPWYGVAGNVNLGARLQVNAADEAGNWWTRFDGSVTEFEYDTTPGANFAYASLTANDVLRNLSNQGSLQSWTKEVTLQDAPDLHWTLDDYQGALAAAESSGNGGPPLLNKTYGTYPSSTQGLNFQGFSGGGVETMADTGSAPGGQFAAQSSSPVPTPQFTTTGAPGSTNGMGGASSQLSAQLPSALKNSGSYSVEAWFMFDTNAVWSPTTGTQFMTLFALGNTRTGRSLTVALTPSGTSSPYTADLWVYTAQQPLYPQSLGTSTPSIGGSVYTGINSTAGVPHHLVLENNAGTISLYLDGALITPTIPTTWPSLNTKYEYNWLDVGGLFGGHGGWQGGISLVSVYATKALTGTQVSNHFDMGYDGPYRYSTGKAIQALGSLTGTPNFWLHPSLQGGGTPNGLSPIDYVDLTGSNALTAMQQIETTELAGVLYVNAQGELCFDGRDARMGATAPSLTLPAGSYDADLGYKVTDQYMQTRAAISGVTFDVPAVAINTAQDQKAGQYPNGTAGSPTALPVLMVNPKFFGISGNGLSGDAIALDPYVSDAANWNVGINSNPPFKAASVTVDALSLTPGSAEYVALSALYACEINTTFVLDGTNVASFPNDYWGLNYFIEGVSESISLDAHLFTFYTSPMTSAGAWSAGNNLDSETAVLGVSAPPSVAPPAAKVSAVDPGRPFLAPTFTTSTPVNTNPYATASGAYSQTGWNSNGGTLSGFLGASGVIDGNTIPAGPLGPKVGVVGVTTSGTGNIQAPATAGAAGTPYSMGVWVYSPVAGSLTPVINWANGGTFVSSASGGAQAVAANTWTWLTVANGIMAQTATQYYGSVNNPGSLTSFAVSGLIVVPGTQAPAAMNTGNQSSLAQRGFVGAADQRGIYDTLQVRQRPPVLIAGQAVANQSIANATWTQVTLDTVYADVSAGLNLGNNPSSYVVTVPGFYDIAYSVTWSVTSAANTSGAARVGINHLGANEGGTAANWCAQVERRFQASVAMVMNSSARVYLGVGTSVGLNVWQDTGSSLAILSTTAAEVGFPVMGVLFSLKHVGYSLTAD